MAKHDIDNRYIVHRQKPGGKRLFGTGVWSSGQVYDDISRLERHFNWMKVKYADFVAEEVYRNVNNFLE